MTTPDPKPWLTIAEAAYLVGRHPSRIYRWLEDPKITLRHTTNDEGATIVKTADLRAIEGVVKRGRPRGVPNRRTA